MADRPLSRPGVREVVSARNPLLKVFRRALAEGVTRDGWVAIEGPLLLKEAIEAYYACPGGREASPGGLDVGSPAGRAGGVDPKQSRANNQGSILSVLFSRGAARKFSDLLERLPAEAELTEVADRLFEQTARTGTPQGVAALVELPRFDLDAILAQRDPLLLVACGLQDPGNLGTMMRSALALGGAALLTLPATVSPFNPKAVRSSAGAIFRLPVFPSREARALGERLRTAGVRILAADARSASPVAQADLSGPVALLVGNEAAGLQEEIARQASERLSIPIRASADSLNAATAAGIFLYEAARQRGFRYPGDRA
jgi:RNA methyltransferase, TrmH family